MRARIDRALERRDAGMTLTEMLVVMLIMGIVIAATVSLTITMSRTTGQTIARQDQVDAARVGVERLSKTVRTAVRPGQLSADCTNACADLNAFLQGTTTGMTFYANLDNPGNSFGPSRITYTVGTSGADRGVLIEKVQRPNNNVANDTGYTYCNAEAPGATALCRSSLTVRRLASGVQTSAPLFRYYDATGDPLIPSPSGLSADNLKKVLAVEVSLTVQSSSPTAPRPTTYIQRITLPNAQAAVQAEEDATP
jgi:prepilin-type N-terminal cleavage/methylation domain-containing protein